MGKELTPEDDTSAMEDVYGDAPNAPPSNVDGFVNLDTVNVHEQKDFEVKIEGVNSHVTVFTVTGADVTVTNMKGKEEVGIKETTWDGQGHYVFPKHSLTLMRWKA